MTNYELTSEQLLEIANTFGTPTYVYQTDKIAHQYKRIQEAFKDCNATFFYACKALTNINIIKFVHSLGAGIDCSSGNEVKLALHAGVAPDKILYTSNGISFDEIVAAKNEGVNINIDSLSALEKFGQHFGHSYPIGIRLRPNIMAGGNLNISTGHDNSKFGIPIEQLDEVLALANTYSLNIRGLHIHTGSDIKNADVFVQGIEVLFNIIPNFPELEFIDLGSGFKVSYKEGDVSTDLPLLAKKIKDCFDEHPNALGKQFQLWFEPGKFMVSEAGYFITQVNVVKNTPTTCFACVNSGFNHLIRPMFYNAYHRIQNISNPTGEEKVYTIVGNICETDTFASNRTLNEIREGDFLVFYNAGAYGFEMSSNFNSRFKPAEVMVMNNEYHLIRRRDNLQDLLNNQITVL